MLAIIKGTGLLLLTLSMFSLFSFKAPKGKVAMGGLAGAAVATFLVEAIHKYICGDFLKIGFLGAVGASAGGLGGPAAATLVGIFMKTNPIFAVVAGVSVSGMGILPGFIAGYVAAFVGKAIEKKLPEGVNVIAGALIIAPLSYKIAVFSSPLINETLTTIGSAISAAANQSPLIMGFLLGGIIKMICTSPLSSMALTAMLGLTGLPMGIAAIACFGGSFTNGIIFRQLKLGDKGKVMAVMLEPLTQADVVTANALPIYCSNFFGGGLAGMAAAWFNIVNNAPGTASPIPGLLAPFGFNRPIDVVLALALAAVGGIVAGYAGGFVFRKINSNRQNRDGELQFAV